MRIVVVAPQYPPDLLSSHADGVVTYFHQMVQGYRDAGAQVSVVTFGSAVVPYEEGDFGERVFRIRRPDGGGAVMSKMGGILRSEILLGHALLRLSRRNKIDLVEIPDWMTPAIGPSFADRLFMKLHGPADFIRLLNGLPPTPVQRALDRRARFWARRVDVLHSGSAVLAEFARTQWGLTRNIPVVSDPWGGIPEDAASEGQVAFDPNLIELVSVGRLEWRKGQHVLLQALNELPGEVAQQRWRLTLIGRDTDSTPSGVSYRAYCEGLMSERTAARVRWLDGVPLTALPYIHRKADVSVVCSLDGNYGYTSIQALCDGACLVTTLEPGSLTSPYVTDGVNGMLVPPDDISALAKALSKLMQDPNLRSRLRQAAARTRELVRPRHIAARVLTEARIS